MVKNLIDNWEESLIQARKHFKFECDFDSRLTTPDANKYAGAYTAFCIAEKLIAAARSTNMVITLVADKEKIV